MKSTMITSTMLATLLSTITASPTSLRFAKRQEGAAGVSPLCTNSTAPSGLDVAGAITQWRSDVVNVNSFLNEFHTVDDLQGAAQTALDVATDEPTQLGVLACVSGLSDASEQVISTAAADFGTDVLDQLKEIADLDTPNENAATDPANVAAAHTINTFRCCTLLPGLATLWPDALAAVHLSGPDDSVPLPDACASILC